MKIGFMSGNQVWEKRKKLHKITTGSSHLDELFGGGIETSCLVEFYGEFRTGKTQLCHQLCVNTQLSNNEFGLEGNALYIDTEGTFRPERIIQMAEGLGLDYNAVLENITYTRIYSSDHQMMIIPALRKLIVEKNIRQEVTAHKKMGMLLLLQ